MNKKIVALCCAVALLASACGSKADKNAAGNGNGVGGDTTTTAPAGSSTTKFGTLDNPCGPGTPKPAPAGTVGVTDTTIKIATISDKAGQVKIPTASIAESSQAFVDWCNSFGGINGRKLELTQIDSKLFSHLEANKEACNDNVFALVGSGAVTDNTGAQTMLDCGLIDVPAYTATATKAMSDNVVQPLPNPSNAYNTAVAQYYKEKYPEAIKHAAILASNIDAASLAAKKTKEAYEKVGFKFVYTKFTGIVQEDYKGEAREMKQKGVKYLMMVSAVSEANKMLRDAKLQGVNPTVIDLGQQYYDPELLTEPGAEGASVQLNTVPFEEADDVPVMQQYLDAYAKVGSKIKPTSLGVQAFSAGLLFATAVKAVEDKGEDLTRANVLAELKGIRSWDAGGLHFTSDPGGNKAGICTALVEVKNGKFVRLFPKETGAFDCNPDYAVKISGNYGVGAKLKGN